MYALYEIKYCDPKYGLDDNCIKKAICVSLDPKKLENYFICVGSEHIICTEEDRHIELHKKCEDHFAILPIKYLY